MGWWATEHGLMGDDPADLVADGITRLDPVNPSELVAALVRVVSRDAHQLFDDAVE